jgi:glucose/mannose-6-phosphate isomerase
MYTPDKENFIQYLRNFAKQISESEKIFKKRKLNIDSKKINNVIYLGMGGSAIAGDVISEILYDELTIPFHVVRNYEIPAFCSKNTLIIASSYSGNTEETLAALNMAEQREALIIAVTSGGDLLKQAKKKKWQILQVPGGYPPRQAFGYLFFLALQIIKKVSKQEISSTEFSDLVHLAETMIQRSDERSASGKVFAKDLAIRVKNKIPIIYSSSPYLAAVARRWKNQFQENSKSMAFSNIIPEMNHNEIVAWEMDHPALRQYVVLFLENQNTNPRIQKRIQLTKRIIRDRGTEVIEVYGEGKSLLEQIVSLIIEGDWLTYYLALLYEKNPVSIVNIDYLKGELKKVS